MQVDGEDFGIGRGAASILLAHAERVRVNGGVGAHGLGHGRGLVLDSEVIAVLTSAHEQLIRLVLPGEGHNLPVPR